LLFQISFNAAVPAPNPFATRLRFDLGKGFHSQEIDIPAQWVQAANQRPVGMNCAAPVIEENTGSFLVEPQDSATGDGVPGNEFGGGKALIGGQAGYFIGIELDFFVAAAGKATAAGKTECRLAMQSGLGGGVLHGEMRVF
jgi:hypothetical protein